MTHKRTAWWNRLALSAIVGLLAAIGTLTAAPSRAETIAYGYDPGNRLESVEYDDGQSIRYVYDNLGNQLVRLTLAAPEANNPPGTVTPGVADGTELTYTAVTLDWSAAVDPDAGDAVVYYLHLGTEADPPLVYSGWERSYTPPYSLQPLTTYFWSVVARDSQGAESVSGPWTFITGNEPPTPIIDASPTEAIVPYTANLTDASTSTDDAIASRAWDFLCDGSIDATTSTASYYVSAAGDYEICLAVTDEAGATESTSVTLYGRIDTDGDGVFDIADNCPADANADQYNLDGDDLGDVCDDDRDGDGVTNAADPFPDDARYTADSDGDGIGDSWEIAEFGDLITADDTTDFDGDGSSDLDEFRYDSDPQYAPPFVDTAPIAAGGDHSLAQRTDGRLYAWGYNGNGELGDGSTVNNPVPQRLGDSNGEPITAIVAIAAGWNHNLALKADGRMLAWGNNGSGRLGDGTSTNRTRARLVLDDGYRALQGIIAIAAGSDHSQALHQDGYVLSWGYNNYGQLGDGTTDTHYLPQWVIDAAGFPLIDIVAIGAGIEHGAASTSDGRLFTWGRNHVGQLADGSWSDRSWAASAKDSAGDRLTDIIGLYTGGSHLFAQQRDGSLFGWGAGSDGRLGDGSTWNQPWAVPAIDADQQPLANVGQPGSGDADGDGEPDATDAYPLDARYSTDSDGDGLADGWELTGFSDLATADEITDSDGDGVLDGDEFAHGSDALMPAPFTPQVIAAGGYHSLAIRVDGSVLAWGYNNYGQLGDGSSGYYADQAYPRAVFGLTDIIAVAAGEQHSLALDQAGQVWAFGHNNEGQLGDGSTDNASLPTAVMDESGVPFDGVIAIAAGDDHSLALKADGTVWAWGSNDSGQLGTGESGSSTDRLYPTQLRDANDEPITGIVAIAAGSSQSFALKADGRLLGWGYNGYGVLGDDTTTNRLHPVAVLGSRSSSAGRHCRGCRWQQLHAGTSARR